MSGHILVVEDDPTIREMMVEALRIEGYDVESAADGEAGVAAVERARPAVMLLDLRMPGLDGDRVMHALRERGLLHFPVILVTAAADPPERAQAAGATRHLAKPFKLDDLYEAVREVHGRPAALAR